MMRTSQAEKMEIIRLVEHSDLPFQFNAHVNRFTEAEEARPPVLDASLQLVEGGHGRVCIPPC